jgi:hypothetical protein
MEKNYKNNKTLPPLSKKTNFPSIILNDENTKNFLKSPKKKNNNNNTISTNN